MDYHFSSLTYLGTLDFLYLAPSPLAASLSLKESGVPALKEDLDALPATPPADIGTERAVRSLTYTHKKILILLSLQSRK